MKKSQGSPGDPPKVVQKIVIIKGTGDPDAPVSFILNFTGLSIPLPPVNTDFIGFQLTADGFHAGYPEDQPNILNQKLGIIPTANPNHFEFEGGIPFKFGDGKKGGIMYTVDLDLAGYDLITAVEVEIMDS